MNEIEVARVHQKAGPLPENEDRVEAVDGIGQQGEAASNRKVPKLTGHDATALPLGGDPLQEKASGEERLAQQPDANPDLFGGHHLSTSPAALTVTPRRPAWPVR